MKIDKHSQIWDKIKEPIGKDSYVEVFHEEKYRATKISFYNQNKVKINFHNEGLKPEQTPYLTNSPILNIFAKDKERR